MVDRSVLFDIFGAAIRERRRQLGLSQRDLCERADLSSGTLSQIERGYSGAQLATLFRLAHALDMTATGLIERVEISVLVAEHADDE